jgi:hypothetical protein
VAPTAFRREAVVGDTNRDPLDFVLHSTRATCSGAVWTAGGRRGTANWQSWRRQPRESYRNATANASRSTAASGPFNRRESHHLPDRVRTADATTAVASTIAPCRHRDAGHSAAGPKRVFAPASAGGTDRLVCLRAFQAATRRVSGVRARSPKQQEYRPVSGDQLASPPFVSQSRCLPTAELVLQKRQDFEYDVVAPWGLS